MQSSQQFTWYFVGASWSWSFLGWSFGFGVIFNDVPFFELQRNRWLRRRPWSSCRSTKLTPEAVKVAYVEANVEKFRAAYFEDEGSHFVDAVRKPCPLSKSFPPCRFPNTTKLSFLSVFLAYYQQNWQNLRLAAQKVTLVTSYPNQPVNVGLFGWSDLFFSIFWRLLAFSWPFLWLCVRWNCPQN